MINTGMIEVMTEGYGFIRGELPENDIYVSNGMIKKYQLRTGDKVECIAEAGNGKFRALTTIHNINGQEPIKSLNRRKFEELTPVFPNKRIRLSGTDAMRLVNMITPIGRGQRGLIVSPPKAGKTTMMKDMAKSIIQNHTDIDIIVVLIDERPEEVTDISEYLKPISNKIEIVASTFDERPENHIKIAERTIAYAKRKVEMGKDVLILLDSITRLTRAYNIVMPPSGKTLSGGLDPVALTSPKKFFGAARNIKEGGSLTIIATALTETGSRMDDVVYEEFKGTGNMELILDRNLQEKRMFPAINIEKSSTRRDDLLQSSEEIKKAMLVRKSDNPLKYIGNMM